jgi:hypothetical protein
MKERKKSEEKKEHKKPWREVYATVEDIQNFLMDRVLLRHNVITGRASEGDGSLIIFGRPSPRRCLFANSVQSISFSFKSDQRTVPAIPNRLISARAFSI